MVFKNQKQLENFLMKQSRQALLKAQDRVYAIIKKFLYQFYHEYDPQEDGKEGYDRTYQFLESLVQSRIVPDGKGYKAEVYFDLGSIDYITGVRPWGHQVMEAANRGLHGAFGTINGVGLKYVDIGGGTKVWDDPIRKLDAEAIDILVDMLRAEGIPVKK